MVLVDRAVARAYELGRRVAVGGMGEVYVARAPPDPRQLAVKRMIEASPDDEDQKLMFLREVAVAATLEHPNVVEVIDAGWSTGELFLVMEFVEGPTLAELLELLRAAGRVLPIEFACAIISNIAQGLAHAHERTMPDGTSLGIVHRDVAPENVLLGKNGLPKLVDFGLATLSGHSLTQPGTIRGRAHALAPEQAKGDAVDHRADVFGLGAILFELATGETLYGEKPTASLLFKVAQAEYGELTPRMKDVDPDLIAIVEKALAPEPDDRFGSARAIKQKLDNFRASRGMRLDTAAMAKVVAELWPHIETRRRKAFDDEAGELEGSTLKLTPDRFDSVLAEAYDISEVATDPSILLPRTGPIKVREVNRRSSTVPQPQEASPTRLNNPMADELMAPAGDSTEVSAEKPAGIKPITSALPRPQKAKAAGANLASQGWLVYLGFVLLAATLAFLGAWFMGPETTPVPTATAVHSPAN